MSHSSPIHLKESVAKLDDFLGRLGPMTDMQRERASLWLREKVQPIIEAHCEDLRKHGASDVRILRAEAALAEAIDIIVRDRLGRLLQADTLH